MIENKSGCSCYSIKIKEKQDFVIENDNLETPWDVAFSLCNRFWLEVDQSQRSLVLGEDLIHVHIRSGLDPFEIPLKIFLDEQQHTHKDTTIKKWWNLSCTCWVFVVF